MTDPHTHENETPGRGGSPCTPEAPTRRFAVRAEAYARARPDYPAAAIDCVLAGLGDPGALAVADVGAGTGISSRLFAQRGCEVIAVEPNAAMQAMAPPHERIRWATAPGERTGLGDASVGLVVCAQAFHWLDARAALREFRRILTPGGRIALLWNVPDDTDAFTRAYRDTVRAHAVETMRSLWAMPESAAPLKRARSFVNYRVERFPHAQALSREGLLDRALSASYTPREGEAREALVRDLLRHFDEHERGGEVLLRYVTEAHLAELRP